MSVIKVIANLSNLLFVLALVLGLYLPQAGPLAYILVLPALAVTLGVTLLRFPGGFFNKPRELMRDALWGIVMNYFVLGNLIIIGGLFLVRDEKLWEGLVLMAAVPAGAVALSLGGKVRFGSKMILAGFAGTYMASLVLIPLIGVAFLKFIPMHYDRLIMVPLSLIVLPLLLSHIVVDQNKDEWVRRHERMITDVCFFIVFYALAANNSKLIRLWPTDIVSMAVIACGAILIPAAIVLIAGRFFRLPYPRVSSLILLGTMKNCGLAGGVAIYIFGNEAGVPALVFAVFMFLNVIWLKTRDIYNKRYLRADDPPEEVV